MSRLLLPACVLLALSASAQMSGVYTIDVKGTGSRNFLDIQSAAYALVQNGVNGAVTFDLAPGVYTTTASAFYLAPVVGVSATNRVTFRSKQVGKAVLQRAFSMQSYGSRRMVEWYVFDGLGFQPTTATSRLVMSWAWSTRNIEFSRCVFLQTYMLASRVGWSELIGIHIHHCTFLGGTDGSYVSLRYAESFSIHDNEFRVLGSTANVLDITQTGTPKTPARIYNNVIWGTATVRARYATVRLIAHNTDFYHNTVSIRTVDNNGKLVPSNSLISAFGYFAAPVRVFNNVFVSALGNAATYIVSQPQSIFVDNNVYSVAANYRAIQSGVWSAWRARGFDNNSVLADPKFVSANPSKPSDFAVQLGSPAIGLATNNPSYIVDDFLGNKRSAKATAGSFEFQPPTTFVALGQGCPGTGGKTPRISQSGTLKLGSTDFAVLGLDMLGGQNVRAYLAAGFTRQTFRLGGGCNLLVALDNVALVPVSGGSGSGNGVALYRINLPSDTSLRGGKTHFQWGVIDPAAKGLGLAMSNAATLTL